MEYWMECCGIGVLVDLKPWSFPMDRAFKRLALARICFRHPIPSVFQYPVNGYDMRSRLLRVLQRFYGVSDGFGRYKGPIHGGIPIHRYPKRPQSRNSLKILQLQVFHRGLEIPLILK